MMTMQFVGHPLILSVNNRDELNTVQKKRIMLIVLVYVGFGLLTQRCLLVIISHLYRIK